MSSIVRSYQGGENCYTHVTLHSAYQKFADLEVAPDPKLVVGIDLTDGNPFVVRSHRGELPIGEARAGR